MLHDGLWEGRRYWSIVVSHERLSSFEDLKVLLGNDLRSSEQLQGCPDHWNATRFELVSRRKLYRTLESSVAKKRVGPESSSYDLFVGFRDGPRKSDRLTFIASPYVRLLVDITQTLRKNSAGEAPRFARFHMADVYDEFLGDVDGMRVSRVTLDMLGEPGLELVSLSGKNPLHSDLQRAIRKVAEPYSLRIDVSRGSLSGRISVDRHGNLRWYLPRGGDLGFALVVVDQLRDFGAMSVGRLVPMDRLDDEGDEDS